LQGKISGEDHQGENFPKGQQIPQGGIILGLIGLLSHRTRIAPTTTRNGGEKSIEYCQLKAATFAKEGQEVFEAAVFAFHTGKPIVKIRRASNITRLRDRH